MVMQGVDFDWSRPLGGVSALQAVEGQELGDAKPGPGGAQAQGDSSSSTVTLRSIALQVQKGELLAICGEVRLRVPVG